ncbi:Uncharacterised protein [Mycobacteroides abscessus subsp. abscessus]|nr:Uncharacterised protein [Mycobacteroides abscessus subsp. abscessus]
MNNKGSFLKLFCFLEHDFNDCAKFKQKIALILEKSLQTKLLSVK